MSRGYCAIGVFELADRCTDCGDDEKWHDTSQGRCSLCDFECSGFHGFTKLRAALKLAGP